MGQYYKGRKIGTCESMYYMRLEEAQELASRGERDDDKISFKDYLSDNVTRFRFPFPEEDDKDVRELLYDKSFSIPAGFNDVNHSRICVGNAHKDKSHHVNIFLPCPYSQEFIDSGLKMSTGGTGEQFLDVLFEGIRDGKKKTIFACSRCGEQQRFDDETVKTIKDRTTEYFKVYDTTGKNDGYTGGNQGLYDYAMKIVARLS